MTILPIIQPNNPILRRKARRVMSFDKKMQTLMDDMVETMIDAQGVGLAAPQVAISQRLIVARLPDDEENRKEFGELAGRVYIVANPEIVKSSRDLVEGVEGCLSIPGYQGSVDRHEKITIVGQDRHGKPWRLKAEGWLARIFQHEVDHLEGRLYIDIANEVWRVRPGAEEEDEAGHEAVADLQALNAELEAMKPSAEG